MGYQVWVLNFKQAKDPLKKHRGENQAKSVITSVPLSPLSSKKCTEGHITVLRLFLMEKLHESGRFALEKRGNT